MSRIDAWVKGPWVNSRNYSQDADLYILMRILRFLSHKSKFDSFLDEDLMTLMRTNGQVEKHITDEISIVEIS